MSENTQTNAATSAREELPRSAWHETLEYLTKDYQGDDLTIEVVGVEYGDQFETEKLPFSYIEYDHKDDVFLVAIGGRDRRYPVVLSHMVAKPQKIFITPAVDGRDLALAVISPDGTETIVTFIRHLALPGPD
jgi:hypothetical protein